jgi:chromosome segregation ATPase
MIRDTGGDLPFLWIIALRLIPFSDLAYMVRHFSQAKRGGIISIIGMWLLVPHLSRELWQTEERVKTMFHQFEQNMARGAANTAEAEQKFMEQMPAEIVSAWAERKKLLQTAREKKVAELQNRIAGWHAQIQAMRASLNVNDEAAVKAFNEQAAAYSRLNTLAKKETELMLAVRSGKQPGT